VGREFIFYYSRDDFEPNVWYVFAMEDASVGVYDTSGSLVASRTMSAGEYWDLSLSNAVYHIISTGRIAIEAVGNDAYTTVPSIKGNGVGRRFYFATYELSHHPGALAVFAYQDTDVDVFDLDSGSLVYSQTINLGNYWWQTNVGTRRLRLQSTGLVEVWAGSVQGGNNIEDLGDDLSFAGGDGGREYYLHSLRDGSVIFAPFDNTQVNVDGTVYDLNKDEYLHLDGCCYFRHIQSSQPILIQTLGRDSWWDNMGTYLGGVVARGGLETSSKTVNVFAASPGTPLTYTITLRNITEADVSNVVVTDTVPVSLTYNINSLSATAGSYGYANGVITWTGSVNAGGAVTITFGATVSQTATPFGSIVNSAVISGGGEIITRTATVAVEPQRIYLPIITRNYCPDFFDDFSNPASGWDVVDVSSVRSEYLNGEFRILTKRAGYIYVFQAPTCDRQNYVVEADARWVGTPGHSYGLGFGITADFGQFYVFDINTDYREFRLRRRDAGGFTTIVPPTYSAAINGGTASNHLKVTRNGDQITLEVNGSVLGTWTDGTITGFTGAGVVSSSYSSNPTSDARFDNFSVISLPGVSTTAQGLSGVTAEVGDLQIPGAHRALADVDQWPRRDDIEPEIK
jgi:uncharacterized repeat protein (TIGR01451 family)